MENMEGTFGYFGKSISFETELFLSPLFKTCFSISTQHKILSIYEKILYCSTLYQAPSLYVIIYIIRSVRLMKKVSVLLFSVLALAACSQSKADSSSTDKSSETTATSTTVVQSSSSQQMSVAQSSSSQQTALFNPLLNKQAAIHRMSQFLTPWI